MARTPKKGLDYFPVDIDLFSDIKIRKLIKYQGGKAISVYTLLLCNIYKNGYYFEWDDELPFICSELTGFDEAYISEVIKTCLALGLFSKKIYEEANVLTSKGIQERYSRICVQSRKSCSIVEFNLLEDKINQPPHTHTQITVSFSLNQEINALKNDVSWLEQIRILYNISDETLNKKLDEFQSQCIADGKEKGHQSLTDAKQHFNSWMRIVNNKTKTNDTNRSNRKNQRRSDILSPTETKTYSDTF